MSVERQESPLTVVCPACLADAMEPCDTSAPAGWGQTFEASHIARWRAARS